MKVNLLTTMLLFISLNVFSQKNNDFSSFEKLYTSIIENLKYPSALQDNCLPTLTLMKIIFDDNGTLQTIDFSDSTHPEFVLYMQKIKDKLDFKSVYKDLKQKKYSHKTVLIPLQIDFEKMDKCKSIISSSDLMRLYLFDGKPCSGEYFLYPYLYFKIVVGRPHEEHF